MADASVRGAAGAGRCAGVANFARRHRSKVPGVKGHRRWITGSVSGRSNLPGTGTKTFGKRSVSVNRNKHHRGFRRLVSLITPLALVVTALVLGFHEGHFFGLGRDVSAQNRESDPPLPFSSTNLPGGVEDPDVSRTSGKVLMKLNLGQLRDSSSHHVALTARYNSNVENNVKLWNRDYPVPDLGLGWNIPRGKIVRVTQETGNETDDVFYYTAPDGGKTIRLKYHRSKGQGHGVRSYVPENNYVPTMVIEHHTGKDLANGRHSYWRVIHADGSIAYFGGDWGKEGETKSDEYSEVCGHINNGGNEAASVASCVSGAVELGVRWGNWIGPSYEAKHQEHFEVVWHLSAVEDLMGNLTTYSYVQHVQDVGNRAGAKSFSKQAYLYRIQQASGNKLVLRYCPRAKGDSGSPSSNDNQDNNPNQNQDYRLDPAVCPGGEQSYVEFFDPWQLNEEPDGYQERYRTLHLGAVDHRVDPTDTNLTRPTSRVLFNHEFLTVSGEAEMAKRVLTNVTPMVYDAAEEKMVETAPSTIYRYWGQDVEDGVSVAANSAANIYNSENGALYGAMKSVTSPNGGSKLYAYEEKALDVSRHVQVVGFQGDDWAANHRFPLFGPGYTLFAGEWDGQLTIMSYRWTQSGWKRERLPTDGRYPQNYNPFKMITMQRDFVAYLRPDRKTVSYVRNNRQNETWGEPQVLHVFDDASDYVQLSSGRNHVSMISSNLVDPDPDQGAGHYIAELDSGSYFFYTTNDRAQTWKQTYQNNNLIPVSSITYAVGVGAGPDYALVARAYRNATDFAVIVRAHYSDRAGNWHTTFEEYFTVPNISSSAGELCVQTSGKVTDTFGTIGNFHLNSWVDIQVSGSMIGLGIQGVQLQTGRMTNHRSPIVSSFEGAFGSNNFKYRKYRFSRPVLHLNFDPDTGQFLRTFDPPVKYSQLRSLDVLHRSYGGDDIMVKWAEADNQFYGLGSRCELEDFYQTATLQSAIGKATMTQAATGFTRDAYGLLYDPDKTGSLDPHLDHSKVSQLGAKCLFGYYDGHNSHLQQVLQINPNKDVSEWRWHSTNLHRIPDETVDYRFGKNASSHSGISGPAPCATSETYVLPGGLAVYTDKVGNRQYLIADPKTGTPRQISVSADRQPFRASNLKAWDDYDQALDDMHYVNAIIKDINMSVMVLGMAMGMFDPAAIVMTVAFSVFSASVMLAEAAETQYAQAGMEAAMDKMSGPAPSQFGSRGHYIQDGDSLLYRNADATLSTVTQNIDVNQLYNGNFSGTQNFLVYTYATGPGTSDIGDTKLRVLRNGVMYSAESNISQELGLSNLINRSPFNDAYFPLASGDSFVTYVADQDDWTCPVKGNGVYHNTDQRIYDSARQLEPNTDDGPCFSNNENEFYLHKFIDDDGVGQITDYVVKSVTVDNGYQESKTEYSYDVSSAGFDTLSNSGVYAEVTVYPGGQDNGNGKTVYDYIVDTSNVTIQVCDYSLGDNPPIPKNCDDGSSDGYFNVLSGTHYRTSIYDSSGVVASETANKPRVLRITDGTKVLYHTDTISRSNATDGVTVTTNYLYDEYLQHAGTSKTTLLYDPILQHLTSETLISKKRRAYLDYSQMERANILSPVSRVTTTRQLEDGEAKIVSGRNTRYKNWNGTRGWLSEETQRLDRLSDEVAGSYTTVSTVERDPGSGVITKATNIDGVVTSNLYSKDGSSHTYASHTNADFASHQAGYFGFEFFEPSVDQSNWDLSGGSVSDIVEHTGSRSYGSEASTVTVTPSTLARARDGFVVASAWLLPNDNETCSVTMGEKTATSQPGDGRWQYIEVTNGDGTPSFSCNGYVDDLRFGPTDGVFAAAVYDDRRKTVAKHGNNGEVLKYVYDSRERLFATLTASDAVGNLTLALGSHGYSRFGGSSQNESSYPNLSAAFDPAVPNSGFAVSVQELAGNAFYNFNEVPTWHTDPPTVGDSFVVHAMFYADSSVNISAGRSVRLRYSGDDRRFHLNGANSEAIGDDDARPGLITLVVVENAGFVFGDGRLLLVNEDLPVMTGEDNEVSYTGTVGHFLVGQRPLLTLSYRDGLGRVIQTQRLGLDDNDEPATTVANATLHDGWGRAAVHTRNMEYNHIPDGYEPALVSTFDWAGGGTMTGDVVNYYHTGDGSAVAEGEDYRFPYIYSAVQRSPLARPSRSSTAPGQIYAVGNELSVDQKYQSTDEGDVFLRHLGIFPPTTDFHVQTTRTPFTLTKKVRHQTIKDLQGRVVATRTGTEEDGYRRGRVPAKRGPIPLQSAGVGLRGVPLPAELLRRGRLAARAHVLRSPDRPGHGRPGHHVTGAGPDRAGL